MVSEEYSEAVVEVLDIIEHTRKTDVEKIPKKLLNFFESVKSSTYISGIDHSKKLNTQDLKPKTRAIIAMLYRNYWCPPEEKEQFESIMKQNYEKEQEALREKYNPDNIFKEKKDVVIEETNTMKMTIYKESIFKRFINRIRKIFKK